MRNKVYLPLTELVVSIAVFAIAAAVCLQGFSLALTSSKAQRSEENAVVAAQNVAELLKHERGNMQTVAELLSGRIDGNSLTVYYDSEWKPVQDGESAYYRVEALFLPVDSLPLGRAEIYVYGNGITLYTLTVGWQEALNQ